MRYNVKSSQIYLFFLSIITFFSSAYRRFFSLMKYSGYGLLLLCCSIGLFSCKSSSRPDVSNIPLDIKVQRFDIDLFQGKGKDLQQTDQELKNKYGTFYNDYVHRMVGDRSYVSTDILSTLYKDQAYTDLTREADSVFKDFRPIEKDLTSTFKYIKYYYPKTEVPKFIAFISGFAVQTPIGNDYMGIGLDMFLGKNSKFYGAIVQSVPMYLSRRFSPEYVVPRVTETFAREELFPERDEDRTLLDKMVQNGKILYFMDQVLPESTPDSVKIGFTGKQLEWCKTFEPDIWAYLLQNKLLFETDYQKIQVFLSEGPFTPGLGERNESAPKLGVWIGWQMVRKYMQENKQITLQQLMAEKDAQKILSASKYKPK